MDVSRRLVVACTVGLMALTLFSLTQCRMIEDRVTGVDIAGVMKAKTCLGLCQTAADTRLKDEDKLNKQNLKDCGGDQACTVQENTRHAAAVNTILADLVACQNSCHHQGAGEAGR
jgi:hypothetical protein